MHEQREGHSYVYHGERAQLMGQWLQAFGWMARLQDLCEFVGGNELEKHTHKITEDHATVSGLHSEDCGGHCWT